MMEDGHGDGTDMIGAVLGASGRWLTSHWRARAAVRGHV